jgi:hypothetical protein
MASVAWAAQSPAALELAARGRLHRVLALWAAVVIASVTGPLALAQTAPTNDVFELRYALDLLSFSLTSTNTLATSEAGEQRHRGLAPVRSLWWRWTAPLNGYVMVNSTNSPSRTLVDVYGLEKKINLLSLVTLQTDSGLPTVLDRYEFDAEKGRDYNIVVDGRDGDKGAIQLDLKTYTVPEVLVPPISNTVVTAGQRASLAVRALGKRPLTHQWQFSVLSPNAGYVNLSGGTDRVLNVGSNGVIAKTDEGWYRVVITNEYGAVTSSAARLDVNECATPTALTPLAVSTNVGKSVSFTASAIGTRPLYYQWQFKPENQWVFTDLPGATSSSLVLTNISTDDAGDYRFLVSNIGCTNQPSTNATLLVSTNNPLRLVDGYPASMTVITNQDALFTVKVAEGYQPIRYQWWYKPLSGPPQMLVGETATNLFLSWVQLSQRGEYWATVSNRYTTISSPKAVLGVETRPPNDNFADRIPIFPPGADLSATNISRTNVYGWNKNATREANETAHAGYGPKLSVWWSFTPPMDGHVIVNLSAPGSPQVMAALTGDAVDRLVPVVAWSNTLTSVDFVATNNIEYVFVVESQTGAYNQDIGLDLTFNPNIDAPILVNDGDFKGDFIAGGEMDGFGDGCADFIGITARATSLDGVVYFQWQFGPTTNGPFADLPGMTNATLTLRNVTTANEGYYRVKVSNRSGAVYSSSFHVTVNTGPMITLQPKSISTNACTAAKFEVQATSCSPLTYQWFQNGQPVVAPNAVGVNSNILILKDLAPVNEGAYYLAISNAHQAVDSQVATLTLTNIPRLLTQPLPLSKYACENAAFSVSAFANCPLTYQWFLQGAPLDGATNSTLALTTLEPTNAGSYFVVVSTPYGSVTSQEAKLTVDANPAILLQPANQNARACDIVNLEVRAQQPSCSWLTYQWQLAGTNILGATNRVYSFEAQAETAGDYQVIVSNRWTAKTSSPARVIVDARPQITKQPAPAQRVREGDSFTNQIVITTCGSLSYFWQYQPTGGGGFTNVTLGPNYLLATNGWLVVPNAQTNHSGYYRVIITNSYASTTSTVSSVRVVRPPANDYFTNAFSLGGGPQATGSGHNEYATAEPGEPDHGLQKPNHSVWWVWTNPFPSLVTVDLAGSDINTLLGVYAGDSVSNLTALAEDDDGGVNGRSRVSFMAGGGKALHFAVDGKSNAEGTNLMISVSTSAITSPPVITTEPLSLAGTAGQTVSFSVIAYGSPDMSIQWYGKGAARSGVVTTFPTLTPTNYLSTLTLTGITTNDDGVYYVVLTNQFGSATSHLATLTFGSIVRGMVSDATKTTPDGIAVGIEGVRVSVGSVSTLTDSDGNYELVGVKIGDLSADFMADKTYVQLNEPVKFWNRSTLTASLLTASKDGFYDYIDDQFEVGKGKTVAKRFSMSPVFEGLRFVLNWTNDPPDLDLVLHLPPSVPIPYPWIDYLALNKGSISQPPFAIRDADMTRGWGPETITIHEFYPGTYSLYARKYPGYGGNTLAQSSAQLVAYRGTDLTPGISPQLRPYGTLFVPRQGTNEWWHLCDIDGVTTNIIWVNEFIDGDPRGAAKSLSVGSLISNGGQDNPRVKDGPPPGANYEWDFGDGTSSNQLEPPHSYPDPGWKTVSLKVTEFGAQGRSTTTIKTNYILVVNRPPTVEITNPAPDMIFRAGDLIRLQSVADGIDDPIRQVDYYLTDGLQRTYLATVTNAPYAWDFPNTNYADATFTFVARAQDMHGASTFSAPLSVRVRDLRGDILILRNFASPEIDSMVDFLAGIILIEPDPSGGRTTRLAVTKVLDQEGLRFDLVKGFKVIIWNDQGTVDGGLADNDVIVLKQAYDAGIPLYLIGEHLAEPLNYLSDAGYYPWSRLLGVRKTGTITNPDHLRGIMPTSPDGLFIGWYKGGIASTDLTYGSDVERLQLTTNELQVVTDVPVPGSATNSPLMLRYPAFGVPDFGETRRLIQDFRPAADPDSASAEDLRIVFVNGVAWLLRMFECPDWNVLLGCQDPDPLVGQVGVPMTFVTRITQNGGCTPGGVLFTNFLSSHLQLVDSALVPDAGSRNDVYQLGVTGNVATVRFSALERNSGYSLVTVATPLRAGWFTNISTVSRGPIAGIPCSQVALIRGDASSLGLSLALSPDGLIHLRITGGEGLKVQVETSVNLSTWTDRLTVQPDHDPYDVPLDPPSGIGRYYRIRVLN